MPMPTCGRPPSKPSASQVAFPSVRQRWLSRRALGLHLAVLIVAPGCLAAFWWQLHRALGGNSLSWAYTFEWPIFSVLAVIGWWQMVHDDPDSVGQRALRRMRSVRTPDGEAVGGEAALSPPDDGGRAGGAAAVPAAQPTFDPDPPPGWARAQRRPVRTAARRPQPDEDEDEDLAAYNRYLAGLAASGDRKTWRRA